MEETKSTNKYRTLEERTFHFARRCRDFVKTVPRNVHNHEYGKQLIRSSGSQAANYIEANEALSKKDFAHRIRISRKETKESGLWLQLIEVDSEGLEQERDILMKEAEELRKIFSAILNKSI